MPFRAMERSLAAAVTQHHTPTATTGIATAGPIGKYLYMLGHRTQAQFLRQRPPSPGICAALPRFSAAPTLVILRGSQGKFAFGCNGMVRLHAVNT